jgi:activator of HSP90 ATPase
VPLTRRAFAGRLVASFTALGIPPRLFLSAEAQSDAGISHTADSIHQEALIKANPARVYSALTDAKQFDGVVKLSAATKSMSLKPNPSVISKDAGGAFSLFGGYVTGRQIELVRNTRIVQVWRAGSWKPGEYSLVKFQFTPQGPDTKLTLDHAGFPQGEAEHLAEGWKGNYFEPLAKYLA